MKYGRFNEVLKLEFVVNLIYFFATLQKHI